MQLFPQTESTFLLPGLVGDLEVLTTPIENTHAETPVGIICHPHPLHGGTMNNKVVTTLARTFKELGLRTIRFNFRGVGKSAGVFDHGDGETKDLLTIVEWSKQNFPTAPIWLAGFSFGSYVAAKAATQITAEKLVCVAPPVLNFPMQTIPPITCPWVVVQGEEDEVVSPAAVFSWVEEREPKPLLIRIEGAGHFFHGKLIELREKLVGVLL
jgi:alpha/beta superfamily hydrolase